MLKYLLEKEFKQFFRNNFLPRLVIVFPLATLSVFPIVATFDVENINLSIINYDKSSFSQELTQKIQSSGYFRITNIAENYNSALASIESDESDVILEIPINFEKSLLQERHADLMISANAVTGTKGGLGSAYLATIINDYGSHIRSEILQTNEKLITPSFDIVPLYKYNTSLLYEVYMVPAIMVMVLAMVSGFLPALNIVSEKENGTIEQMNVTPVTRLTFILSKLIPYWIIGYVVLTICMLIARFVWNLLPVGSFLTIYFFVTIFILAFSGFGLVISNYAATVQQAMFMMFFFVLTFIFMSGLYTPVENMPNWAQLLSNISPLKYIIQVLRMVYLKGSGIFELMPQFIALSGFAILFNGWAVISYRKTN